MIKLLIILAISSLFIDKFEHFKHLSGFSIHQLIFLSILFLLSVTGFIIRRIVRNRNRPTSVIKREPEKNSNLSAFGTIKKD